MKTIKSLTEAEIAEYPNLPASWQWARLGEIADNIQYGYTESSTDESIGPKFLRITDIQNNEVNWKSVPYCKIDDAKKQNYILKDGDLVFARTGATVGKSYLLKGDFPESVFASYLIRVRLLNEVSELFVYNFFQSLIYWKQITEGQVGIGQPNVNGTKLSLLIVPVAPLLEQRAIVSKIEQLFSELDNGISNLKLAQEQLKVYRQAVLKKAFEGELTKKWRKQQTDLPDAEDLLKQISKEKEEASKISGKNMKPAKPLTDEELSELPRLPEGWFWVKFSEACNIKSNLVSPEEYKSYPHIAPDNIERETGQLLQYRTIEEDQVFSPKHLFYKDQIIYSKIRPYLNKLIIAPFDGLCSADMYPIESCMITKYLFYFMLSKDFVNKASNSGSRTILPKINRVELGRIPISLCSLPEQQAIVQEIETRLSVCDKIERDIKDNLERTEALRQSILKKAFEGKLLNERELSEVRKAEDWGPAEVLLERIKAERAEK